MDSLAGIFIGSFIIGLSGALMPGPMFVAVVSQTPRRGVWTGPVVVLGHGVLESALVAAVILGLAEYFSNTSVLAAIAVIGGAVLLYMGVDMLRSAGRLTLFGASSRGAESSLTRLHPFWAGIVTSLSNPYWILWWATIGLGYMVIARQSGPAGLIAFLVGHILSDLVWYSTVSLLVAGGRRWLTDGIYRGLIRVCAVVLVFFAIYFGWHGFNGIGA
ncbi:MAG TPA: LysE family transporter [Candidatus Glassbacteria bacterium]|nr:LysE family transporter [Candidatus Glassbacteria bacterium]